MQGLEEKLKKVKQGSSVTPLVFFEDYSATLVEGQ